MNDKNEKGNQIMERLAHLSSNSISKESSKGIWNGFFHKTMGERHSLLKQFNPDINLAAFETGGLPVSRATLMIENCIGKISLPIGLG